jgi:GAF domain-containing protein
VTVIGTITPEAIAYRELQAVRDIAHAFLVADGPEEVYQYALDRITPLLGASFSLVLRLDAGSEYLHPVAQHRWPDQYTEWIGALRVRVGHGPSGVAVAEGRVVEVADLHADPLLAEWFDVATELGFRSIVAAPLVGSKGALGAIAFYFSDERHVTAEQGELVRVIADQLAATSDKALLIAELRRANAALADAHAALESQAREQDVTQMREFGFFRNFSEVVLRLVASGSQPFALERVSALASAAREAAAIERGGVMPSYGDIDPREPLLTAIAAWRLRVRPLPITVGEPTVLLPTMRSDVALLTRALNLAIGYAVCEARLAGAALHADVELGRGFVAYQLHWSHALPSTEPDGGIERTQAGAIGVIGAPFDPFQALAIAAKGYYPEAAPDGPGAPMTATSPLDLPLARSLARLLGGDVQRTVEEAGELATENLSLIFPLDAAPDTDAAMARLAAPSAH